MLAPTEEMLADGNFCRADEKARRLDYLQHFLRLANRGGHGGASGGEKRAYRLAKAIDTDVAGLDAKAVAGLIELARIAASFPMTASDLCPE